MIRLLKREIPKDRKARARAADSMITPKGPGRLSRYAFLDETEIIVSHLSKQKGAESRLLSEGCRVVSEPIQKPNSSKPGQEKLPVEWRFRPMELGDLPSVLAIETRSYVMPWSEGTFLRELEEIPQSHLVVVEGPVDREVTAQTAVVGYACWWEVTDECHIANVTVAPESRGRGVGKFLVEGILEDSRLRGASRATLEVRVSNATAIGLYEKCGFTSVAMRRKYYPDNGEDALVMWKERI